MPRTVVAAIAAVLALGACGTPRPPPTASSQRDGGFPITVEAANGSVRIPERPRRIVSLSPTGTEMLFAIGAGDQVVAVDSESDYPPEVPTTDLSGFEPNVEAVASYDPDLVVASDDLGDLFEGLEALEVPTLYQPAARDLSDTYEQLGELGAATGHPDSAAQVAESMKADIAEIVRQAPELPSSPTYFHELDDTLYTATSDTFIGEVYGLLGLRNIADEAPGAAGGFPQLSTEYVISADPDLIFLADTECCGQSLQTVSDRPGWDRLTAVRTGAVIPLDDDVASRWGPRVVEFLRTVASAVRDLEVA
jgi:iron complex transport system substrate-binding protein